MDLDKRGKAMSVKMKLITSAAIWFCNVTFGMAANFMSPLLVELKNKYHTDIKEISFVFTIVLVCYLLGALTFGVLYNYLNRQLITVALFYGIAVGIIVIPFCPTKLTFFINGGCIGFATGGVDLAMVVWMLELWQGQAGVYVHAHYFFFAVGTVVAPLLVRPFLLEEFSEDTTTLSTTTSTTDYPTFNNGTDEESQIHIPLSIGGGIIFLAASIVLFLFFYDRYVPPPPRQDLGTNSGSSSAASLEIGVVADQYKNENFLSKKNIDWNKVLLIVMSAIVLGCYQGMELSTFQFMPTFTHYVEPLRLSERASASVLAGLTGAYAVGRFSGIFISKIKIAPVLVLLVNGVLVLIANLILLLFSNDDETLLWTGAVLLGLGYSTIFACIYDHIEKHLEITNVVGAIMVIAGGLVSALYPLIIGDMVETKPFVLMYTIFFSVVACTCSFSCIYFMTVFRKK